MILFLFLFSSSVLALVYFLCKPAVAFLCNGELDALSTRKGYVGLVSLADDKHIIQPEITKYELNKYTK